MFGGLIKGLVGRLDGEGDGAGIGGDALDSGAKWWFA